ncbi:MAG: hypothetical protein JRI25_01030 [Deltaproteobacteria bacterium]|nr:hypothetical protein [Deltaproteobacteria bacterium]MBW2253162.1 hypothetical protein [Deltaproteobacteria bacterium]
MANLELGRTTVLARTECLAVECVLGQRDNFPWELLLEDDRKVDSEVRAYYEAKIKRAEALPGDFTAEERALLAQIQQSPKLMHHPADGPGAYRPLVEDLSTLLANLRTVPRVQCGLPQPFEDIRYEPDALAHRRAYLDAGGDGPHLLALVIAQLAQLRPAVAAKVLAGLAIMLAPVSTLQEMAYAPDLPERLPQTEPRPLSPKLEHLYPHAGWTVLWDENLLELVRAEKSEKPPEPPEED